MNNIKSQVNKIMAENFQSFFLKLIDNSKDHINHTNFTHKKLYITLYFKNSILDKYLNLFQFHKKIYYLLRKTLFCIHAISIKIVKNYKN